MDELLSSEDPPSNHPITPIEQAKLDTNHQVQTETQRNPLAQILTPSEPSDMAQTDTSIENISSMAEAMSLADRKNSATASERMFGDKLENQADISLTEAEPSMEDELEEPSIEDEPEEPSMEDELEEPSMEDELEEPSMQNELDEHSMEDALDGESGREKLLTQAHPGTKSELKIEDESLEEDELMSEAGPEAPLTCEDLPRAAHSDLVAHPESTTPSLLTEAMLSPEGEPSTQKTKPITSARPLTDQEESLSEVGPSTQVKINTAQTAIQVEISSGVELSVQAYSPAQTLLSAEESLESKSSTQTEPVITSQPPTEIELFSEADLLVEPEVSIEDQLLIETEPLYEIQALDELESPVDDSGTTPVNPPLTGQGLTEDQQPSADFKSTAIDTPETKSHHASVEDPSKTSHNSQLTSKKPPSKNSIRHTTNSSKPAKIDSNGQPSKARSSTLSSSNIPLPRSNPLSIRSNLPQANSSSKKMPSLPKIPGSIHQTKTLTASKSSLAKSLSSVSSSTSTAHVSDKATKSSRTIPGAPFKSIQPSTTTKAPHSSTLTPQRSIQRLRATPSKSSLVTPSKPTPSTTPSKPRSVKSSTPLSLSRASSSLKKSQSTPNGEIATGINVDILNGSSVESSPKTSAKSSQAFREMLAKAKRSRPKPPTAPNSPDPDSVPGLPSVADQTEALDPWGFEPIERTVEKAQKTGKLNASSRMLSKLPAEIYAKLLSHTSIFHPSNRPASTPNQKQPENVDLKFSFDDQEKCTSGVAWYETVDLIHLNMSLNELTELDEEFGGFEALTNCDLHCNQLTGLPYTFGLLTNLTLLDLSSNQLSQFPIPILSLINLIELNLSKNQLTRLWPLDWKPTLKKQLATAVKPAPNRDEFLGGDQSFNSTDKSFNSVDQPSTITDSSFAREEFNDQFPSSPTKSYLLPKDGGSNERTDRQPFPNLRKLKLSGNKFTTSSLFGRDSVQLPMNILELDLSKNPLGDCIEVSSNLRNLQKLIKLNLCGCGLSDNIFWFDLEGDYDQLETEENALLEHLAELDLSHNAIDSLEPLESFFDRHCSQHPRLAYEGLPRELVKVVIHHGQGGRDVKVMIGNNFLREEARRRRKVKMMNAQSSQKPAESSDTVPSTVEEIKQPSTKDNVLKSSPEAIKEERATGPPLTSNVIITPPNPTQILLLKHHNQTSSTLNLNSLHLAELPEDPEDYNGSALKIEVEHVNVSGNQLSRFPSGIMNRFSTTLTVLNLSRNRLLNSSSDTFDTHVRSMMGIKLPELVELNLASNFLSRSPQLIIKLIIEGFEAFKLKTLDLSLNQFESLDGLYELLKLHRIPDHRSDDTTKRQFRLEKLLLDGNRISQIDDLVRISTEIMDSITNNSSEKVPAGMSADHVRDIVQYNFLEEIGLSDNSIGQLPPCLGYLPTKRMAIARNLFRFPLRKVYDCADGDVKILSWLRDRN
ncbi:uncharacterized protein PGTG_00032 [Puccinia graminis f. sp. tritici CRL 75-36-700-3]|uniref:Leucine-rich repeat-containing protein 40 n=1 Tax=Puccinia graminis f. sp. tritici (strain CRL 75-36-700-3 / race SCCL) TaxID=418459 RepID=E3JPZ3_PUCGT|nr:uncharacterized protein PGTG_00032 [Puccinia graminis f. sp. tritici CRL 75-36-700-3]EFP74076.2 hypothetical protein PGTG_00032 [Puccinia graminis f. sp. tritici CRL 75-36-700-3]